MGESHVTTALEERVKADPSDVGAWISLAERARGKGRTEEARELLEEGLESSQSSEVCTCMCLCVYVYGNAHVFVLTR